MGRILLATRLALRDLRHRPAQAILLLLAITAAAATLALGLALNGVTSSPYLRTKNATNGPDVTAIVFQSGDDGSTPADQAALLSLARAPGVAGHSGPFPVASATLRGHGYSIPVQAVGRDASSAVDRPLVTAGSWVRPGGVVLERTFAAALGATVGDRVTLNGKPFTVTGIAVSAALPEYPGVCYYLTCNAAGQDSQAEDSGMGLVWATRPDVRGLSSAAQPLSYLIDLKLSDPATAAAFAAAHGPVTSSGPGSGPGPAVLTWQQVQAADNRLVSVAQQVLTPGAWLAVALSIASVAVLAGGRMMEQNRRVGQLKAAGASPAMVTAVLLAEHVLLAVVAAVLGLAVGWLVAPLLSGAGAGLIGAPGSPALGPRNVVLVLAVALGVTLAATLASAFRAARTSAVSALTDTARPPRRHAWLIAASRRLPPPLLIGLRLTARRPRRALLGSASSAITVMGIVAVLDAHHALDVTAQRFNSFHGLTDPVSGRVTQVMTVLTIVLVSMAAVNVVITGWATAVDARRTFALSRALGSTTWQVSCGLSAAQLLPVLPGSLAGLPLGVALFAVANGTGQVFIPPYPWLAGVVIGALTAVALLTAFPASVLARQPVARMLRADPA